MSDSNREEPTLLEAFQRAGEWWLPDDHQYRVASRASFDPNDGVRLQTIGAFKRSWQGTGADEPFRRHWLWASRPPPSHRSLSTRRRGSVACFGRDFPRREAVAYALRGVHGVGARVVLGVLVGVLHRRVEDHLPNRNERSEAWYPLAFALHAETFNAPPRLAHHARLDTIPGLCCGAQQLRFFCRWILQNQQHGGKRLL